MDTEVKQHSVTANDVGDVRSAPLVWMLNVAPSGGGGYFSLPLFWSQDRDVYLRDSVNREGFWASAIYIAVTKLASKGWDLTSDSPDLRDRFQAMLLQADNNQSWVSFLSRHLQDYFTTDNGAFIEIVKATSAAASRTLGLMHLDSGRCTRTGDPDFPVVYRDTKGGEHAMRQDQVIYFSDLPDSSETWYGVGHCAASRAWDRIVYQQAINSFRRSKITGEKPQAVHIIKGIAPQDVTNAVNLAKLEAKKDEKNKLLPVAYLGAVILAVQSDEDLMKETIDFASLPEGFDPEKELSQTLLLYADALGIDIQDLQPLSGQPLGTATQSQTLDAKARGKGSASWEAQVTHQLNQKFTPDTVEFAFSEKDTRQNAADAAVTKARTEAVGMMTDKKFVTPAQGAQMLSDWGEIPQEFVPVDETPTETIADTDKPALEPDDSERPDPSNEDQPPAEDTPPDDEQVATKELKAAKAQALALVDRILADALG